MAAPYVEAAEYVKASLPAGFTPPVVGIVCGSGLSAISKNMTEAVTIKYENIPGFVGTSVAGHKGELVLGMLNDVPCAVLRGRFHFYETCNMRTTILPAQMLRCLGCKLLVVTNASGSLRGGEHAVGDILSITDHFGMPCVAGWNPMLGPNDNDLGPRFPSTSDMYSPELQEVVRRVAGTIGLADRLRPDSTYCYVSGPTYETPAESRFLAQQGDCVGMSTVPELIAAKHCGMKVICLALITNIVVMPGDHHAKKAASHGEVLESTEAAAQHLIDLVTALVKQEHLQEHLDAMPEPPTYDNSTIVRRNRAKAMLTNLTWVGAIATASLIVWKALQGRT